MLGRLAAIFSLSFLTITGVWAQNNCPSALLIPFPATDTSPFSAPVSATFSTACVGIPNPVIEDIEGGSPCTIGVCSQEVWFYTDPSEPTQQNLHFQLTTNFNGRIKWVLLYSESVDASAGPFPQCAWLNGNSTNLTQRGSGCADASSGVAIDFLPEGLDGSGYFFLLIQRETGSGGNVSVSMRKQLSTPTVTAPLNDACSSASLMQTPTGGGLGIDDLYASGGAGTWADALDGTTKGATKMRLSGGSECSGSANNEDTFFGTDIFANCYSNNTIDDDVGFFGVTEGCINNIDNSVFYTFTPPADRTDWYIHLGDISCSWGPDTIQVLLADNLDCTNADNTTLLSTNGCNKAGATGLFPDADLSIGPLTLFNGVNYAIIVDGKQAAQCDFKLLLTTSPIVNAILPYSFTSLRSEVTGSYTSLAWEISDPEGLSHFEIERSLDGQYFERIGQSMAEDSRPDYSWIDTESPAGKNYYRIVGVDLDGGRTYSDLISVEISLETFSLESLYFQDEVLQLRFVQPAPGPVQLALYDLTGRLLFETRIKGRAGVQQYQHAPGDLGAGMYLLRLSGENTRISRKFLVD